HFALLSQAQLSGKAVNGLGEDGAVRRSSAASDGTTAAVEEPQRNAALASYLMQRTVGLVDLPGARNHATVLVRVGIAEHDLLAMLPALQQRLISLARPKLAAHCGSILQIFNGLKQRNRLEPRIVGLFVGFDSHAAKPSQPEHMQHILRAGRSADDVLLNRFRRVGLLQFGDGAEGVEYLARLRRKRRWKMNRRRQRSCASRCLPGRDLSDCSRMNTRMLPNVECLQMQA